MDLKKLITGNIERKLPKEYQGFNWGAFLLTFIWGYFHKAYVTFWILALIIIKPPLIISLLLFTLLPIYFGIMGNRWAYQQDWKMTPIQFKNKQKLWGISALTINAMIPLIILLVLARFATKSSTNTIDFINNSQCELTKSFLDKNLKNYYISSNTTEEEIIQRISKKSDKIDINKNTLYYKTSEGTFNMHYEINITKPKDERCDINLRNCTITTNMAEEYNEFGLQQCVFYFDNQKIVPDNNTQKSVDKGLNIFKYL